MNKYEIDNEIKDAASWLIEVSEEVFSEQLLKMVAYIFKERVKKRLSACQSYLQTDIQQYVNAITIAKIDSKTYRIYAGSDDAQLNEDMYYLEYGTGIVGKKEQHPNAAKIGWFFRRDEKFGNENTFIAKTDKVYYYKRANKKKGKVAGDERSIRSFGIVPLRYFYDTVLEFEDIIAEAYTRITK